MPLWISVAWKEPRTRARDLKLAPKYLQRLASQGHFSNAQMNSYPWASYALHLTTVDSHDTTCFSSDRCRIYIIRGRPPRTDATRIQHLLPEVDGLG